MGLVGFIKAGLAGRASAAERVSPQADKGSQRTLDIEAQKILAPLWGVQQPQDLEAFRTYYLTHWLARRAINSLVRLTLSEITVCSEDEDLDRRVLQFNRAIGLPTVLANMLRQLFTYGASYAEIVFDAYPDPSEIVRLHVCDSRSMRVDLYPDGRVRQYYQLPQFLGVLISGPSPISIPTDCILHLVRDPIGDYCYGHSILQPIASELKSAQLLESAMVKSSIRAVTGQDVFSYGAAEGESSDEAREALDTLVASYNAAEPGDPLFAAGMGEWSRLTPGRNNPPPLRQELEAVWTAAISGCDLNPDAMGIPLSQSMHQAAEQRIVLLGLITSIQQQIVEQLNSKLYRVLADAWNTNEIAVEMKAPTLSSEKESLEAQTIAINNVGILSKMGVIGPGSAANELGYDAVADEERFDKWLDSGATLAEQRNPQDHNTQQQDTKTTRENPPPTENSSSAPASAD